MARKILIIGGVACGPKAAARARRRDGAAEIIIVERGRYVSYASCGMPYYVGGTVPALNTLLSLSFGALRDEKFFAEVKDIRVLTGTEATAIDRGRKRVRVRMAAGEQELAYDQLVIATGAGPKRPRAPGMELGNVFHLWTLPDAQALRDKIEAGEAKRVCIIGSGLIGLEAAEAMVNQAVETTVVELLPQPLAGQLDPEMGGLVADVLREAKVAAYFGESVKEFIGEGGKVKKVITDRREIEADVVLLATGADPNVTLARECGIEIGALGAIKVDAGLRTSDPDVFAGGDCVEDTHLVSKTKVWIPLGSTANLHGRVIGNNLTGGSDTFPGVLGTGIMKVLSANVGFTGLTEVKARELGYDVVSGLGPFTDKSHYYPGGKGIVIKVVADRASGRVLGVQAVGPGDVARIIDASVAALTFGTTLDQMGQMDFAYAPPFGVPIEPLAQTVNIARNKREGLGQGTGPLRLKELLASDQDFVLLDVRSAPELKARPPIADRRTRTVDMFAVRQEIAGLPKDRPVIVVCQVGMRSFDVQCALKNAGFDASFLEGGMSVFLRLRH
jgi:NADPH-dependent 2,4-dienoyl-CoA reductase/sulfur reductase-like enzyme/rhodanese-related sulfurtransferase